MSGAKAITNNWRRLKLCLTTAIVVIYTLLAAYVCILFIHFSELLIESPPDKGIHHQTYSQQAKEIKNSNLGFTGGLPLLERNDQGENNEEKSESAKTALDYLSNARDLAAQEGVWRASNTMAKLAFVQTIIGFVGLVLIARTLNETQKASSAAMRAIAEAARTANAAESAERAYLAVEPHAEIDKEDRSRFKFYIRVKNYGNTPARNIQGALIFQSNSSIYGASKMHVGLPKIIKANGEFVIDSTRIDGAIKDYIGERNKAYTKESPRSLIAGLYEITYQDVFDEERKNAISDGFSLEFDFTGWDIGRRVWQEDPVEMIEGIDLDAASQSSEWISENIKRIQVNYWRPPDKKA